MEQYYAVFGLYLDILGTFFLVHGLIVTKRTAVDLGVARICGETDEQNLKLPAIKDIVGQSRNAIIGGVFLILGFVFQIMGNWPE